MMQDVRRGRLCFIDLARTIAILSMLEGHFITMTLAEPFRDRANPYYHAHLYRSGLTAPLFLALSGLVFVYFLCSSSRPLAENPRVKKGIKRGVMLIGMGYLLQVNLIGLFEGWVNTDWLMVVHILQVVGVGLLALVAVFALQRGLRIVPLSLLYLLLALVVFSVSSIVHGASYGDLPVPLQNYLTRAHGSVFTLFPSLGYMFCGGACGVLVNRFAPRPDVPWMRASWFPVAWLAAAICLHLYAVKWVYSARHAIENSFGVDAAFITSSYLHVILGNLGLVLALLALLMLLEPFIRRWTPELFLRIGQQSLFIYILHNMILYGGLFGIDVVSPFKRALSPMESVLGAVLFMGLHVLVVQVRVWLSAQEQKRLLAVAASGSIGPLDGQGPQS